MTISEKSKKLFLSMVKLGVIGFGGGCAMIPVIEKEVVNDKKLLKTREYDGCVLSACVTPGALPVELACGIGRNLGGIKGMLISASLMAFPGTALTILILTLLSGIGKVFMTQIQCLSIGLSAFIESLLLTYTANAVKEAGSHGKRHMIRVICLISGIFILTCGKSFAKVPGLSYNVIFGLSTVDTLFMSFFGIFFLATAFSKKRAVIAGTTAIAFIASAANYTGKHFENVAPFKNVIAAIMTVLMIYGIVSSVRKEKNSKGDVQGRAAVIRLVKEIGAWLVFITVLSIPAVIVTEKSLAYILKGFISSFISFGGGDAYLTVADGFFVESGMITDTEFYTFLVPVANVLPGSILTKILAGAGYYIGINSAHSIGAGIAVALAGIAVATGASGILYCLVAAIYDSFSELPLFNLINKWIKPIVGGLLINVMFSMVVTGLKTGVNIGENIVLVLAVTFAILMIDMILYYKKRPDNLKLIMLSSVAGLVITNAGLILV